MTFARRIVAEGLGTALLLAVVVGSGIMAERLAGGNVAIALLANAIATVAGFVTLILMFGTISGTHFNPVVTLSEAWKKNMSVAEVTRALQSPRSREYLLVYAANRLSLATVNRRQRGGQGCCCGCGGASGKSPWLKKLYTEGAYGGKCAHDIE